MNKAIAWIVAALFLVTAAGTSRAGEARPDVPVRLSDAVALAMKQRPELRLAFEKEHLAEAKIAEARGAFLPTLDFVGSNYYIKNFDTYTGIDISAQVAGQNIGVNVEKEVPAYQLVPELDFRYNLYAGGRDRALLKAARSDLESVGHEEGATRRKVRLDVADAYWGLKKAQIAYAMAKRALALVQLELSVAQTQHRVHRLSAVDYDAVLLKKQEKEVALRIADRDALQAFGRYRHVLGLPEETAVSAADAIPALLDAPDEETTPVAPMPEHPDILRLTSELQAASQQEEAAAAEAYPTVDFFANYALIGRDTGSLYGSWANTQSDYYSFGIKVTLNLYNGDRTRDRIREAESTVRVKRLELALKIRELTDTQRTLRTALDTARDQLFLAMARHRLEAAREKAARARLQSGRISDLAYRQSATDAADAGDKVTMARIDVTLARNALELMVLQ